MFLLAAISLGFLGSFHCVGMCGPIALAIPIKGSSFIFRLLGSSIYNFGRVVTYFIMGLLFGLIGQTFAIAGFQNILSVTLGLLILVVLLLPDLIPRAKQPKFITSFLAALKTNIRRQFGIHSNSSLFFIGLLNGLLPCGLVYMGIAGSIATGDIIKGSLFMATFGLGTLPAMILVSLSQNLISLKLRSQIRKAVPVFIGTMALLLILRGLNLGIPYLSPKIINENGNSKHQCCSKKAN